MTEPVFAADSLRLLIAAAAGILLLLLLIIKFKIHPVLSLLIAALVIGLGAGMPVPTLVRHCGKRRRRNLAGNHTPDRTGLSVRWDIGSVRRRTVRCQTLINKFGEKKAGIGSWNHRTCGRNYGIL